MGMCWQQCPDCWRLQVQCSGRTTALLFMIFAACITRSQRWVFKARDTCQPWMPCASTASWTYLLWLYLCVIWSTPINFSNASSGANLLIGSCSLMHVRVVAIMHCVAVLATTMPVVRTTSNAHLRGLALAVTAALCVREVVWVRKSLPSHTTAPHDLLNWHLSS